MRWGQRHHFSVINLSVIPGSAAPRSDRKMGDRKINHEEQPRLAPLSAP
jgi:hypothetical protein